MAARYEDAMKNVTPYIFGSWKSLSKDDVGVARGTVFQEIWSVTELVSKLAISLRKNWGGYRRKTTRTVPEKQQKANLQVHFFNGIHQKQPVESS